MFSVIDIFLFTSLQGMAYIPVFPLPEDASQWKKIHVFNHIKDTFVRPSDLNLPSTARLLWFDEDGLPQTATQDEFSWNANNPGQFPITLHDYPEVHLYTGSYYKT